MTSALCSTNGRISSPAPNLSPTSFIAGSRTSLSVGTAPIFSTLRVDPVLDAVLLAAQDVEVQRLLGLHALGRVGHLGLLLLALGLEVRDEALQRVLAAVEDEVVGELALLSEISPYGVMWFGLTIARSSPASTQWCRKTEFRTARARGRRRRSETFETPSEVLTPGISALIAADALDRLDRGRLPLVVAGGQREGERRRRSAARGRARGSSQSSVIRWAISTLRSAVLAMPTSSIVSAISAAPCCDGERHDDVELVAAGLEVDRVDDRAARDLLERASR